MTNPPDLAASAVLDPPPRDSESEGGEETPVRLLTFYDRLRRRILKSAGRGRLGRKSMEYLLLAPDVFMLLTRLFIDREVPMSTRALIGGALAYFIMPVDLLPEAFVGVGGLSDDLVLAAVVLTHALSRDLEAKARSYWSGSEDMHRTLSDISRAGESLLGIDLYERLLALLRRRGVDIAREAVEPD